MGQCAGKTSTFAPLSFKGKYQFSSELGYYSAYASALYGVTMRRGGFDCLRHYEILASGTIPFFIGTEELVRNPLVMYAFPRELMVEGMRLPGMPSEAAVASAIAQQRPLPSIDTNVFNRSRYCEIREALLSQLPCVNTAALARYVIGEVRSVVHPRRLTKPQILMVTSQTVGGESWTSAFLYHGLRATNTSMLSWMGRKDNLYAGSVDGGAMYGHGFTYAHRLPEPTRVSRKQELTELREGLQRGRFNMLIVTTANNRECRLAALYGPSTAEVLNDYISRFSPVVVTVDGNDIGGCRTTFSEELSRVDVHFLREVVVDSEPSPHARLIAPRNAISDSVGNTKMYITAPDSQLVTISRLVQTPASWRSLIAKSAVQIRKYNENS
ncbi:MAG: hypothetical protein SGPRY_014099 [Prymnesium sp.]